jgi:DNA-directed RNA polymerase specialized sigma subunit
MTQPTIGWLLGISTSRVCQIEKSATAKLRAELEAA